MEFLAGNMKSVGWIRVKEAGWGEKVINQLLNQPISTSLSSVV